jgi:hypothetical protein
MARRRRHLIAGEEFEPLMAAVRTIVESAVIKDNRWMDVDCKLPTDQALPVCRALMRIEAELLRSDARLLGTPKAVRRTSDQRSYDAFMILLGRLDTFLRRRHDLGTAA